MWLLGDDERPGKAVGSPGRSGSEGNVVFLAAGADRAEVRFVCRDVAVLGAVGLLLRRLLVLLGLAATVAVAPAAVTGAEELHRVGDDLDRLAFAAAFFGLPLAP